MTRIAPSSRARMGRSRLGGVPAALPPPLAFAERQLPLPLGPAAGRKDADHGRRETCLPGVVHVAGWLDFEMQRSLVAQGRNCTVTSTLFGWSSPVAVPRAPA